MNVVLTVGAMSVSCETDYRPEPSGKCSKNDAARKALFERLLVVAVEKMREWMFKQDQDAKDMPDLPSGVQPGDYVRTLEKALEPVLSVEGAIEQAKRTDREITCRYDERLFQSLNAVAEAQKIMQPVATIMELAPGAKA